MSDPATTSVRIRRLPSQRPTKRALTLMACLVATAFGASCAHAVGGRYATLSVVTRGDSQVLPVYAKDGRNWVVGTPNQEYALRVCNSTGGRVLAVMSVDGVNIITGDTASPLQSGYVLSAWECADIGGWRKSLARTAAFYFTELPDAYAARTGRPENVGVIGVAVFPERPRVVRKDAPMPMARQEMRDSGSSAPATANDNAARAAAESSAQAPADASGGASGKVMRSEAAPPAAPMAKLGTGHEVLTQHAPGHRLQDEEHGAQVDRHHAIPLGLGYVEHRLHADDTRVVEEDVEATPAPVRLLDHALDILAPRDIGADRDLAELGGHLLHAGIDVGQDQPGAVGREPARARRADPTRSARDQNRSSVELSHRRHLPNGCIYRVPGAHSSRTDRKRRPAPWRSASTTSI